MFLNTIFFVIYLILYMYIYKKYPQLIIIFFYLFYGYLSMVISVYYLDFGNIYAFEVAKYSYQSHSLLLLETIYISTFIMYVILFKQKEASFNKIFLGKIKNKKKFKIKYIQVFLIFSLIYIFIIYIHMIISGVPLFLGEHKGMFWEHAKIPLFQVLHRQTSTVLFILGFFYGYIKIFQTNNKIYQNKLKFFKPILFIYILYIFLMGYKFGGPLQYLFSFYISYLLLLSMKKKFDLYSLFKYFIYLAMLVVPMVLFVYMYLNSYGDGAGKMLFDRIFALQGQVWHFIYHDVSHGIITPNLNQISLEIDNLINHNHQFNSGMNHLMQYIMPQNRLNNYLEEGVRLSGGYPAILFVIFDNIFTIIIVNLLLAYIIFLFHINFLHHLLKLNLLKALLWFKVSLQSEGILFMADINSLFSVKVLFYLSILLLIKIIEQKNSIRKLFNEKHFAHN